MMKQKILNVLGLQPTSRRHVIDEFADKLFLVDEQRQREIYAQIKNRTMIGGLGILANMDAIDYLCQNKISGAIVECGVWKGGSVAAMLSRLMDNNDKTRKVFLFDTFAGMTAPTAFDKKGSVNVVKKFEDCQKSDHNEWCYSPLTTVKETISMTGYPNSNISYVQGDVLKTLPETNTGEIALLRLDTDWYESTKCEMEYLFPKVVHGGVIIIDDYGAWEGARKAVDEYFAERNIHPLMFRIDQTRRMFVKMDSK